MSVSLKFGMDPKRMDYPTQRPFCDVCGLECSIIRWQIDVFYYFWHCNKCAKFHGRVDTNLFSTELRKYIRTMRRLNKGDKLEERAKKGERKQKIKEAIKEQREKADRESEFAINKAKIFRYIYDSTAEAADFESDGRYYRVQTETITESDSFPSDSNTERCATKAPNSPPEDQPTPADAELEPEVASTSIHPELYPPKLEPNEYPQEPYSKAMKKKHTFRTVRGKNGLLKFIWTCTCCHYKNINYPQSPEQATQTAKKNRSMVSALNRKLCMSCKDGLCARVISRQTHRWKCKQLDCRKYAGIVTDAELSLHSSTRQLHLLHDGHSSKIETKSYATKSCPHCPGVCGIVRIPVRSMWQCTNKGCATCYGQDRHGNLTYLRVSQMQRPVSALQAAALQPAPSPPHLTLQEKVQPQPPTPPPPETDEIERVKPPTPKAQLAPKRKIPHILENYRKGRSQKSAKGSQLAASTKTTLERDHAYQGAGGILKQKQIGGKMKNPEWKQKNQIQMHGSSVTVESTEMFEDWRNPETQPPGAYAKHKEPAGPKLPTMRCPSCVRGVMYPKKGADDVYKCVKCGKWFTKVVEHQDPSLTVSKFESSTTEIPKEIRIPPFQDDQPPTVGFGCIKCGDLCIMSRSGQRGKFNYWFCRTCNSTRGRVQREDLEIMNSAIQQLNQTESNSRHFSQQTEVKKEPVDEAAVAELEQLEMCIEEPEMNDSRSISREMIELERLEHSLFDSGSPSDETLIKMEVS